MSEHYHICEMSDRVKSCQGKISNECDSMTVNNECNIPLKFGICDNYECKITAQLDFYKNKLEETKSEVIKLKAVNTQFRVLMLMPATAGRLLNSGEIDFSGIKGIIARQRPSWNDVDDVTALYMVEYHQKYMESWSELCAERNSKVKIKDLVVEKRKQETTKSINKLQAEADKKIEQKAKLTPFGKQLAAYMKIGMQESDARATLLAMGLKET